MEKVNVVVLQNKDTTITIMTHKIRLHMWHRLPGVKSTDTVAVTDDLDHLMRVLELIQTGCVASYFRKFNFYLAIESIFLDRL